MLLLRIIPKRAMEGSKKRQKAKWEKNSKRSGHTFLQTRCTIANT